MSQLYWKLEKPFANDENKHVINNLLLSLKNTGKKTCTIERYRMYLQAFFKDRDELFSSVTLVEINQWLEDPRKGWKERTRKDYKKVIRLFYNYCIDQGYIEQSPMNDLNPNFRKLDEYWTLKKPLQNIENEKVINAFLARMKELEKGRSFISQTRTMLQRFFMHEERSYASITSEDINQWMAKYEEKWTTTFQRDYISVLSSFFSFCFEEGYIEKSPLKKSRWVKAAENYWEVQQPLANSQNKEVINEYLLHCKNLKHPKKTIEEKRIVLQRFFGERKMHFSLITSSEINAWFERQQKSRKVRTVGNYLTICYI